jgi:hypothetical protein
MLISVFFHGSSLNTIKNSLQLLFSFGRGYIQIIAHKSFHCVKIFQIRVMHTYVKACTFLQYVKHFIDKSKFVPVCKPQSVKAFKSGYKAPGILNLNIRMHPEF